MRAYGRACVLKTFIAGCAQKSRAGGGTDLLHRIKMQMTCKRGVAESQTVDRLRLRIFLTLPSAGQQRNTAEKQYKSIRLGNSLDNEHFSAFRIETGGKDTHDIGCRKRAGV